MRSPLTAALLCLSTGLAFAQSGEDLKALNAKVVKLNQEGKSAEAIEVAKQVLALAEKQLGPTHPDMSNVLDNLAALYRLQGNHAQSEPLYKRSLAITEKALGPEHPAAAVPLKFLAEQFRLQGRLAEAEPYYKRAIGIHEQAIGAEHPSTAALIGNLAQVYQAQSRFSEAEPLLKRGIASVEKARGPDHPDVASLLTNLASLYDSQRRYAEAAVQLKRILDIREKTLGPQHLSVGWLLGHLAGLYQVQGRFAEAEPLRQRSLAVIEKARGPDHADVASAVNNLAELYRQQGRFADAEPLYNRGYKIIEKTRGPDHTDAATTLNNLATLHQEQRRLTEAEQLYQRSLAIREKALGPDHVSVGTSLNNLALLLVRQQRYSEAEPLMRRSLAIREKALGAGHPDVGTSLNNLALLYFNQRRYPEAETLYKRALSIIEKALGGNHPDVGGTLNNLAELFREQGRYLDAEPLYKRSLNIRQAALGPDHPDVGQGLSNLATLLSTQARHSEAEPLHTRSLEIRRKAFGPDHPEVGYSLYNLAGHYLGLRDWARARDLLRQSTAAIMRRAERDGTDAHASFSSALNGKSEREGERSIHQFSALVKASFRVAAERGGDDAGLAREMFEAVQSAQSSDAAASLGQMAARGAAGHPALATAVRERQDLVAEWLQRDKARIAASALSPEKRDRTLETGNATRLAAIDLGVSAIDKRLSAEFPDYATLVRLAPIKVEQVQALLRADEALVMFFATPAQSKVAEEGFIWVVTKTDLRWARSDMGLPTLRSKITVLRKGLDVDDLKKAAATGGLFDLGLAHELYTGLLAPVAGVLKDKPHLIIVATGPLTSLPFHLLVTEKPAIAKPNGLQLSAYAQAKWLTRKHAVTVLPAVSSLHALRALRKAAPAPKPMIGYGDPVFKPDQLRRAPGVPSQRSVQAATKPADHRTRAFTSYWRGTRADLDSLRSGLAPLPETADELRAVAKSVDAVEADLRLGPSASETTLKAADLRPYRIVYFATHGLVAGQLSTLAEPALALTLPMEPTVMDDGLLTASEVSALKLNADWVVLSACNTAAGDTPGADALSGLARAFFYAGARALMVSHWQVDSAAAVRLTTGTFAALQKEPKLGRSEALRRAMIAMIDDTSNPWNAYPDYWAPFSVVGEGGR